MNYSHRSPKGNRHMRRLLNQAANAAVKAKGTILEIVYRRTAPRLGHKQTIGVVAHRQCRLIWLILHQGVRYEERGLGIENAARAFRSLIDCGVHHGGSYYLTYHRWATRDQVETCYPMFAEFLRMKRNYDPDEMFQSDWYRHYKKMFEMS